VFAQHRWGTNLTPGITGHTYFKLICYRALKHLAFFRVFGGDPVGYPWSRKGFGFSETNVNTMDPEDYPDLPPEGPPWFVAFQL